VTVSHEKNEGRISALEAENAELRARVDLLEGRTPAPKPLPIEGTRVFKPKPVSSLIEPTDDELGNRGRFPGARRLVYAAQPSPHFKGEYAG